MSDQDPYVYPGTTVLRNRPGLRDAQQLQQYEYRRTAERALGLFEQPVSGAFDLDHLKRIHRHLFQDVYDWAGQIRTVSIAKDTSTFAMPSQIESYGRKVFDGLAREKHLQGLGLEAFADRLAFHFSEINAVHPFREGNGRTTRVFVADLARQAGYTVDYARVEPAQWNDAARASFMGELGAASELFRAITRPLAHLQELDRAGLASKPRDDAGGGLARAFEGALDAKGVPPAARDALREHFKAQLTARQAQGESFGVKVYDVAADRPKPAPEADVSKDPPGPDRNRRTPKR